MMNYFWNDLSVIRNSSLRIWQRWMSCYSFFLLSDMYPSLSVLLNALARVLASTFDQSRHFDDDQCFKCPLSVPWRTISYQQKILQILASVTSFFLCLQQLLKKTSLYLHVSECVVKNYMTSVEAILTDCVILKNMILKDYIFFCFNPFLTIIDKTGYLLNLYLSYYLVLSHRKTEASLWE